jgi:hypothetical protein
VCHTFSKVVEYKISKQKSVAFLNEHDEKEIRKTIPFKIASKRKRKKKKN